MMIQGRVLNIQSHDLLNDAYCLKTIPQNSVKYFLDIGASVGCISLLARFLHPYMKIGCIEPHKETYKMLQNNVSNLRIRSVNAAYGNGEMAHLLKDRKTSLCNSFMPKTMRDRLMNDEKETETCQSFDMITLINMCRLKSDSLGIKMDCEGSEHYLFNDESFIKIAPSLQFLALEVHDILHTFTIKEFINKMLDILAGTHTVFIDYGPTKQACNIQFIKKDLPGLYAYSEEST